ncbi:MAG TPA: hypothetical protein VMU51_11195 [Mycobacteriales bacterium]|nr:hypothetical protein [Mycobacteriales bacterium]
MTSPDPPATTPAHPHTDPSRPLTGARIGLDLDGVCCDYVAYLRRHLITAGRDPATLPSPRSYRLTEWFDTPDAHAAAHTAAVAAGLHRDAPAIPGAPAGIRALQAAGALAVAVSARGSRGEPPAQVRADIQTWATARGITFDGIHLGRPKSAAGCHAYVDDSPDDIGDLRADGQLAIVFDQPWNRHLPAPRTHGWTELPALLTDLLTARQPHP